MGDLIDLGAERRFRGFSVLLTIPPSVNALYANARGKGRVKSVRYKTWITSAGHMLNRQDTFVYDGPVSVHVSVRLKDKRVRDLDNLLKPILDLLGPKGHKLIVDDAATILQAIGIRLETSPDSDLPPGWCRVVVKPLQAPE